LNGTAACQSGKPGHHCRRNHQWCRSLLDRGNHPGPHPRNRIPSAGVDLRSSTRRSRNPRPTHETNRRRCPRGRRSLVRLPRDSQPDLPAPVASASDHDPIASALSPDKAAPDPQHSPGVLECGRCSEMFNAGFRPRRAHSIRHVRERRGVRYRASSRHSRGVPTAYSETQSVVPTAGTTASDGRTPTERFMATDAGTVGRSRGVSLDDRQVTHVRG
jgi:hypothetical protein